MDRFIALLQYLEPIRQWISALATPVLTRFIFLYHRIKLAQNTYMAAVRKAEHEEEKAKHEQLWKKGEFVATQAKEFFTDKRVERVIYMLDWSIRKFTLDGNKSEQILFVHDENAVNKFARSDRFKREILHSW
jgi:hypothetical protein